MEIFPENVQHIFDNWMLRFIVLFSLCIQCSLVLFGNTRRFYTGTCLKYTLWFAYMLADSIATTSLGILSRKGAKHKGDDDVVEPKYVLLAFWGPLLLLHLGGSDTMTAYSMEDNALWTRRILSYSFQVFVAILIFLRSWTNTKLNILVIPIFITGIIKIGERIKALWSASSQEFKESLFPDPDPGPNFARYIEAYKTASNEGYEVDVIGLIETPLAGADHTHPVAQRNINPLPQKNDKYESVIAADKFLNISKLLFADLILSFQDVSESRLSLLSGNAKEGFEVMEVELGFMYDLFYTKAPVIYSLMGFILRFVTLSCTVGVWCVFSVMEKNQYPKVDVLITAILLIGAITLEMYSVISLLHSDSTMLWLTMHDHWLIRELISLIWWWRKRWSSSIGQFNLINFCFLKARKEKYRTLPKYPKVEPFKKKAAKWGLVKKFIGAWKSYKKFDHIETEIVTDDLKEIIFENFRNKIDEVVKLELEEAELAKEITRLCARRGEEVLRNLHFMLLDKIDRKKVEKIMNTLNCSVEVEFDQSILLWHIATNLCYNSDSGVEELESGRKLTYRDASKFLSEYMLYLLVKRPSMLPNGIGEIRFQDTCAEATEFVRDRHPIKDEKEVCQMLLTLSSEIEKVNPSKVKGDRSKSILFDACKLAKHLKELGGLGWETKEIWKLITQVWVEMLAYAACHCQVIHHAQHLRNGGELLTHVWLLMAHLGITDRLQISKGFGRAQLMRK